jgi:hypothetical protein
MSNDLERMTAYIAAIFGCGTQQVCSEFLDDFDFLGCDGDLNFSATQPS